MGRSSKDNATTVTTARADLKTSLTYPQSGNLSADKLCFVLDRSCVAFDQPWLFKVRKMGNKKHAACFATLLQNELNRDVVRFTTHVQTCLATNQVVDRWVVKGATSLFNSFCSDVAKQVACFLLPVFAYLKSSS